MNYETPVSSQDTDGLTVQDGSVAGFSRRTIIIAVVLLAALTIFVVYTLVAANNAGSGSVEEQVPTISVVTPAQTDVAQKIKASGTLAARNEILVSAVGEGGRVARVLVDAGDWVKQGQILAVIDRSVQVQQESGLVAQVGVARADLKLAQANLDRAEKLIDRGFISDADVERLQATRDANAARLRVAQAQLAEGRARTSRLDILAPKGGYVLDRNVEPGQTVTQSSGMLFRIAQGGQLELRAQLSEADLAQLQTGVSAEVTPSGTTESFIGQIWQISPTIDSQTRQGTAKIALGFNPALRPGGFANAVIEAGTTTGAILPESAVQNDEQGSYLYIVDAQNKIVRRNITIGGFSAAGVTIASGLTGTEKIVLRAGGFLNVGETVKPVAAKP